jgi:hypothetical protein
VLPHKSVGPPTVAIAAFTVLVMWSGVAAMLVPCLAPAASSSCRQTISTSAVAYQHLMIHSTPRIVAVFGTLLKS